MKHRTKHILDFRFSPSPISSPFLLVKFLDNYSYAISIPNNVELSRYYNEKLLRHGDVKLIVERLSKQDVDDSENVI